MNCANHPDREHTAFCQNCGKPLCGECTCTRGNAVFCEPCLSERLGGNTASTDVPYGTSTASTARPTTDVPNPMLAGLLGLIPGVGAMYNGQYAKGIVHLVIFAVLVSLSDTNGIFGLIVAGWIFYQVIEAHHTARARRDGMPLPNPFGLNDIGEKLGFGKSWTGPAASTATPPPPSQAGDTYSYPQPDIPAQPMPDAPQDSPTGWNTVPQGNYSYPPPPPVYGTPFPPQNPLPAQQGKRFPTGAVLLIAFGTLFFIRSSGWLPYLPIRVILPFLIMATGVWIFFHKMTLSGFVMTDDGSATYRLRLYQALRGAIWVFLVGVLFLLDTFHILSWSHSWPLFIILGGLMKIFERSAYYDLSANFVSSGPATPAAQNEERR